MPKTHLNNDFQILTIHKFESMNSVISSYNDVWSMYFQPTTWEITIKSEEFLLQSWRYIWYIYPWVMRLENTALNDDVTAIEFSYWRKMHSRILILLVNFPTSDVFCYVLYYTYQLIDIEYRQRRNDPLITISMAGELREIRNVHVLWEYPSPLRKLHRLSTPFVITKDHDTQHGILPFLNILIDLEAVGPSAETISYHFMCLREHIHYLDHLSSIIPLKANLSECLIKMSKPENAIECDWRNGSHFVES